MESDKMHKDKTDIEDLLADESFINYCKRSSPEDIAVWESWLKEHPDRQELAESAKASFFQVFNALAMSDLDEQETLLMNKLNNAEPALVVKMQGRGEKRPGQVVPLLLKWVAPAAAVAITLFFIFNHTAGSHKKEGMRTFASAYGERKNFQLPDGCMVTMNAGSKINITDNYGLSSRDIYLEGEAFFDVKPNKTLPFIVHTSAMDIKALGTAFNVKAYPGEKITEASLVSGLVEILFIKEKNHKIVLHPNQKVQWMAPGPDEAPKGAGMISPEGPVQNITKADDGAIKETAWTRNKLVFADEPFEDIALLLERWYGVKIVFADDTVRHYRFTGSFEKEKLATVLLFLKESRGFNYEIKSGETIGETIRVVLSK